MRIFFSVGEPSGDLHASNLIRRLCKLDPQIQTVGFGGPKMRDAGCQIHFDLTQLAVMFLSGVIKHLRTFFRLIDEANEYFANHEVDAVVLIDYPGFNWWIARKAKKHDIPVFYYGVPQMWAWGPWRIKKIRKFVDFVICKLPFEPDWFRSRGCEAFYVGHPFFDQLHSQTLDQDFIDDASDNDGRPTVLLLPGSRTSEVKRNLEMLIETAHSILAERPEARVVMGCFNGEHKKLVDASCNAAGVEAFADKTQELMQVADASVACSGSVSLELLYHRLPSVIVYKIKLRTFFLQAFFLKCKFITLPNLMMATDIRKTSWFAYNPDARNAEPVLMPEYLTTRDSSEKVARHILKWIGSESENAAKRCELDVLARQFANPGATSRAADYIINNLRQRISAQKSAA